jgi:regulator of sirC expression with transglutaminase-like and TPR domain
MFNLNESIVNHRDSGDFILDILEARKEFADDPHSLGIRILNIIADFEDKVKADFEKDADTRPVIQTFYAELDKLYDAGDYRLKMSKEWGV